MFKLNEYLPKSITCFKEGYTRGHLLQDATAGVSVGIIALPLALAFAIASGVPPDRGLFTAIIAGFLISALGGSRIQIGGPTGAFVVIVYSIVERHGYEGLAIATLLAGFFMILMGIVRCGVFLKYIPGPVITGFTTGIAAIIFSSQMKDFFGLEIESVPGEFFAKWSLYWKKASTWNFSASLISCGSLATMISLKRYFPRFPGTILAIVLSTLVVIYWNLPVETIGSKFGELPRTLPKPYFPHFSFKQVWVVIPDAIAIALLGTIESLLSAAVADRMTGHRHRSNCELVAQGIANMGSILFGGIPATGAIARTTANIKLNAKTPVSGMIHAVTLLMLMLFFAPIASLIPLSALAAVLVYVAWNMSELHQFAKLLRGNTRAVLMITFATTILVDLTAAVAAGVALNALLQRLEKRKNQKFDAH